MRISLLPISLSAILLGYTSVLAQEWTHFHGSDGRGTSEAKSIPIQPSKSDFNWEVKLPGTGHSSPVIWGDKIFLTTTTDESAGTRQVICINAKDGSLSWRHSENFNPSAKHKFNDYSASTPAVDQDHIYVAWTTPEVVVQAIDHDGNEVWRKQVGKFHAAHGSAMSPIVTQGKVLLGNQIEAGESFIIALDAKTGEQVWKLPRTTVDKAAYGTPALIGNGKAVYASTAHGLTCIEIDTGKVLWEHTPTLSLRTVAKPTICGDFLFFSGGNGGGRRESTCIQLDGDKITEAFTKSKHVPYVPSGVAHDGFLFLLNDGGQVTCVDPANGDELWFERVTGEAYASPLIIDGKLYCFSREGEMVVVAAKDEMEILGKYQFPEGIFATPAVSNGILYVRTFNHLFSIGGKK